MRATTVLTLCLLSTSGVCSLPTRSFLPGGSRIPTSPLHADAAAATLFRADALRPNQQQQRQNNNTSAIVSSALSVVGGAAATTAAVAVPIRRNVELQQRLVRCAAVFGGCMTSYALSQSQFLTVVQASALTGLMSCLFQTPGVPAAVLCGSFAGMSSHLHNFFDASGLGMLSAAMYYVWDKRKIGVGRGGRLGTIVALANFVYISALRGLNGASVLSVPQRALDIVGADTAAIALLAGAALYATRKRLGDVTEGLPVPSKNKLALESAFKVALLGVMVNRLFTSTGIDPQIWVRTAAVIFTASMVVKQSAGIVLPVALVGLVGSFFKPLAAPIYLGAFLGMTGLKNFKEFNFAQGAMFASTLFHLGLLDGFGGKLGLFAFLGVFVGL